MLFHDTGCLQQPVASLRHNLTWVVRTVPPFWAPLASSAFGTTGPCTCYYPPYISHFGGGAFSPRHSAPPRTLETVSYTMFTWASSKLTGISFSENSTHLTPFTWAFYGNLQFCLSIFKSEPNTAISNNARTCSICCAVTACCHPINAQYFDHKIKILSADCCADNGLTTTLIWIWVVTGAPSMIGKLSCHDCLHF